MGNARFQSTWNDEGRNRDLAEMGRGAHRRVFERRVLANSEFGQRNAGAPGAFVALGNKQLYVYMRTYMRICPPRARWRAEPAPPAALAAGLGWRPLEPIYIYI